MRRWWAVARVTSVTEVLFFFQAEDGIRDLTVTGVQTCALPILPHVLQHGLGRARARAVFLVDGRSASAPETVLQFVRQYKLGLIVGETTGGTNGKIGRASCRERG